jgi:ribosomal protein S10
MKTIVLKSYNKISLKFAMSYLKTIFDKQQISYYFLNRPIVEKGITILKSPHVYKKFKEHYVQREYTLILKVNKDINITSILPVMQLNKSSISITIL